MTISIGTTSAEAQYRHARSVVEHESRPLAHIREIVLALQPEYETSTSQVNALCAEAVEALREQLGRTQRVHGYLSAAGLGITRIPGEDAVADLVRTLKTVDLPTPLLEL